MKKNLLWASLLFGTIFASQAQGNSCATATELDFTQTKTVSALNGAVSSECWGAETAEGDELMGVWYMYTPAENGYLTLTSAISSNSSDYSAGGDGIDTRVSVYSGTCSDLTCYYAADDVSTEDFRTYAKFPVAAGTTYYIAWDNFWQDTEFDFDATFESASCLYPSDLSVNTTGLGTQSITINWDEALTNPTGYEVLYGAPEFDPQTEGELVETATNSVALFDLEAGSELYYYIRSVCDGTSSAWVGPFYAVLGTTLPYANNFDNTDNPAAGFGNSGFEYITDSADGVFAHTPTGALYSETSTDGPTSSWLFVRPIYMDANEQLTVNFFANYAATVMSTGNFQVTIGTSTSTDVADHTILQTYMIENSGQFGTFEEFTTNPYTTEYPGIYYIGIHNITPEITPTSQSSFGLLFIDTMSVTSALGTKTVAGNKLSVYPNPSTDVINVANAGLINSVKVADLNGRTVKAANFDGVDAAQVSIADLASGVYMMTVASDKGTNTTKIVKN